jgi:signal transduction histidine kinase/CheY-like chemotaxis protein
MSEDPASGTRPAPRRRRSKARIVGLAALAWLALALARGGDLWWRRSDLLAEAERRAANLTLILAEYLKQGFDSADAALIQLAIHSQRVGGVRADPAEWRVVLEGARAGLTGVGSLSVTDAAGVIRHSTIPVLVGQSRADHFLFRSLAEAREDVLVADTPFQSLRTPGSVMLPLGRRLASAHGVFDGTVVATFLPSELRRFLRTVDVGAGGTTWIFHPDGVILVREPSQADPIGQPSADNPVFLAARGATAPGLLRGPVVPGGPVLLSAHRSTTQPSLIVAVSLSQADVLAEWNREARVSAALLAVLGMTAALGLLLAFRQLDARDAAVAELQQARRLEAIAHLTGGVAHDFNNILMVILGNVERLRLTGPTSTAAHAVDEIETAARRAADLTHRLLAFARRQPLQPRLVDLNQPLDTLAPMLKRLLGEDVTLRVVRSAAARCARLDAGQLEAAIMNLCVNARDAMPRGGLLTIDVGIADVDRAHGRHHPEVPPGRYVTVGVSDTGIGIPPENLPRLFEPFFTTKEVGKGTGLGLSSVHGFVAQSGGHVTVTSEVGRGTTIRLYFPEAVGTPDAAPPPLPAPAPAPAPAKPAGFGATVLLIEDEPSVRMLARDMLEELGYDVLPAADGPAALALEATHPEIDLAFTDVMLPNGMNGRELAEELRRRRPGLPIVFASGYPRDVIEGRGEIEPGWRLLTKPYPFEELADALRAALSERRPG